MLKRFLLCLALLCCLPPATYSANTMVCSPWMGRDDNPSDPICRELGCRVQYSGSAGSGTALLSYGNLYLGTGLQPRHCAFCSQEIRNALGLPSSYAGSCQSTFNGGACATNACGTPTDWCSWSYYDQCPLQGGGGGVCETPGSNIHIQQGVDPGGEDGASSAAAAATALPTLVELTSHGQKLRLMTYATDFQLYDVPADGSIFPGDGGVYFVTPPGVREVSFLRFMARAGDLLEDLTGRRARRLHHDRVAPFTDLSRRGPREVLLLSAGDLAVSKRSVPPLGVKRGEVLVPQMHVGAYPRLLTRDATGNLQAVTMKDLLRLVEASAGRVSVRTLE